MMIECQHDPPITNDVIDNDDNGDNEDQDDDDDDDDSGQFLGLGMMILTRRTLIIVTMKMKMMMMMLTMMMTKAMTIMMTMMITVGSIWAGWLAMADKRPTLS